MDEANFKVLLCTLLSFPFSIVFKRLPDRRYTLKNYYILGVSAFFVFGILDLGTGLSTLLISAGGSYFITRYLRTSQMPWVNFIFLMGHLAYSHFHIQFFNVYDPTKIDLTGAQMVLVMKLSAFGWNVYDGKQELAPSEYTQARVIKRHPNLLPFAGYVFFYPSLLTGPAFDYVDYDKFIHLTLFDDVPEDKRPGKRKRRIPRSGKQATMKVVQGLLWAVLFIEAPKHVSLDYVLGGKFLEEHNFIYRIFYLWILGISHRLKYYVIWTLAEGACILCGIGYNGIDPNTGEFLWNRVQNIDPWAFETGQNVKVCLELWNMNTNKWLKHYVYARYAKKGKKPGFKSTLLTFATSAFWHGTRPGYYLTFVMGAYIQTLGKIYRRNLRPLFLEADGHTGTKYKWAYDVVCFFVTQLAFGFICQPFMILNFGLSLYCWSTVYFYVPVVTVLTLAIFKGPFSKKVIAYLDSKSPSKQRQKIASKFLEKESSTLKSFVEKADFNSPSLGVPPIEALEEASRDEFETDLKELAEAWESFKGRNEVLGIRSAYNNFVTEMNDIFEFQRAEYEKQKGATEETKKKAE